MRAAIYARISQDATGQGLGVARQLADCRALVKDRGWIVTDEFVDNDVSASSRARRIQYERLLAAISDERVDVVVCWHTDRLHRKPLELETYISLCETHHVDTVTVKAGDLNLSTATGRMVARLLGATARAEADRLSERIKRKHQERREAGMPHGGRAFGHHPDGSVKAEEAEIIADMAERILAGHSLRAIAKDLNNKGVQTVNKRTWTGTSVKRILLHINNRELIQRPLQVKSILESNTRHGIRSDNAVLTGLAICGICGRNLHIAYMYRVRKYQCRGPLTHLTVDASTLERLVYNEANARIWYNLDPAVPETESSVLGEIATLREKMAEVDLMYAEGELDREGLNRIRSSLTRKIEEAEKTASRDALRSPVVPPEAIAFIHPASPINISSRERREAYRALVGHIIVKPGRKGLRLRPDRLIFVR